MNRARHLGLVVAMASVGASCTGQQPQKTTTDAVGTAAAQAPAATATTPRLDGKRFGLSMYTLGNPYFAAQKSAAEAKVKALGGEIFTTDAGDQIGKQIADVEDLLALGIDVLILNPKDPKGLIPATHSARDAGVPVICLDSGIDPAAYFITNVQANNEENGRLVGTWIAAKLHGRPIKMALLSGVQGNPVGQLRREGVFLGIIEAQLRRRGQVAMEIVGQGWGGWNALGGLKAMEDLLVAHSDINLLLSENDDMALGALKAIREAGKAEQVLVAAAADGQKEAIALIRKGEYGVTGINSPVLTAETAVDVAARYLAGKRDFPPRTLTPAAAITRERADEFYDPNALF